MWKQGFLQSLLLNIATVSKCQRPLLNAFCVKPIPGNSIPCTMRCTSNYPMPPTLYNHSVPKSHLKLPETTTLFRRIILPLQILQGQKEKVRMFWNLERPFPSLPQPSLTLSLFLSKEWDCLRRFATLGWALGLVQFLQSHKAAPHASSVGSATCAFPCNNGKSNTWI
jgi:hypothetical protein